MKNNPARFTAEQRERIFSRTMELLTRVSPHVRPNVQMVALAVTQCAIEELGGWDALWQSHCCDETKECRVCAVTEVAMEAQNYWAAREDSMPVSHIIAALEKAGFNVITAQAIQLPKDPHAN